MIHNFADAVKEINYQLGQRVENNFSGMMKQLQKSKIMRQKASEKLCKEVWSQNFPLKMQKPGLQTEGEILESTNGAANSFQEEVGHDGGTHNEDE